MTTKIAVGAIELSSIGVGFQVQDALLKSASVEILIARTICSGKYLIIFSGNIGDVEAAMETALHQGQGSVVDHLTVANTHQAVFPAMAQSVILSPEEIGALGIIETFSAVSALIAADTAGKAAKVTLFRLSLAMAMGGKGLLMMTGSVSDVETAVEAAADILKDSGLLANKIVIPRPERELFAEYI
ncbi:MAG: BMC domain-containing protein [Thermoguttaceae bacterium]|nr:BMC domain-containing protein [Thermoguttaceae bacterium]